MLTYLLINCTFILLVVLALRLAIKKPSQPTLITVIALLLLTAVFDSLIVGFGIVNYDSNKILGAYVGNAPVEDFLYAVLAVVLVPAVWVKLGRLHDQNN